MKKKGLQQASKAGQKSLNSSILLNFIAVLSLISLVLGGASLYYNARVALNDYNESTAEVLGVTTQNNPECLPDDSEECENLSPNEYNSEEVNPTLVRSGGWSFTGMMFLCSAVLISIKFLLKSKRHQIRITNSTNTY